MNDAMTPERRQERVVEIMEALALIPRFGPTHEQARQAHKLVQRHVWWMLEQIDALDAAEARAKEAEDKAAAFDWCSRNTMVVTQRVEGWVCYDPAGEFPEGRGSTPLAAVQDAMGKDGKQ